MNARRPLPAPAYLGFVSAQGYPPLQEPQIALRLIPEIVRDLVSSISRGIWEDERATASVKSVQLGLPLNGGAITLSPPSGRTRAPSDVKWQNV